MHKMHVIFKNIPEDVTWNILKYLSHPITANKSLIIDIAKQKSMLYQYLDKRFNIFYFEGIFNPSVIKIILKTFKHDIDLYRNNNNIWNEILEINPYVNKKYIKYLSKIKPFYISP